MAASLESVSVPFPSKLRNAIPVRAMESPVSALSSIRRVGTLPGFRGLSIQVPYPRRSLASSRSNDSRIFRRGGRIVCEAQKTALEVPAVTDVTWKSLVVEADLPVLVEFWAPWCGPCSMIHPVIDILSKKYAGKLKCFKLNTDESPSIATRYGIRSIPTVTIFKNGDKKDAVIGAVPETTLIASIEKFL